MEADEAEAKARGNASGKPAEAATATQQPTDGEPVPPDPENWTGTYESLEKAKIQYLKDFTDWKLKQPERDRLAAARVAAEAENKKTFEAWVARRDAAKELDPEFADAEDIVGKFFTAQGVSPLIIDSEVGPELVMHFYRLPVEEQKRVAGLSPARLAREILRVEAKLSDAKPEGQLETKPTTTSKPNKTSAAAKPATELSGRNATNTVDDADAAIAAGDSAGYRRIMNARDLAKRKH